MTPYAVLGLALLAVLATVISALAMSPRKREQASVRRAVQPRAKPRSYDEYDPPIKPRRFVPPTVHPTISLSPRQIERINIQRKLTGRPPFNRKGLTNAIAHPWDRYDVRQPQTANDWISYLITYEIFFADHQSNTVGGCQGVNIDPNLPYNGHGGEFAGAGASGDWGNSLTRAEAAAVEHGASLSGGDASGNPAPSYDTSPTPSYSPPPDTSSSYSAPGTSPSSSFDSGSSSSFDSGSSSFDAGSN